jgi:excisionase family DNA binding protein
MAAPRDHHNLGGSNRLLNVTEAAAILGVRVRSLRDYHRKWGIPAGRVGRELRFRERDIHAWIAKRIAA